MNLMEQIAQVSRQLENVNRIRNAIGAALTKEQQLAVSAKIAGGPEKFIEWIATDEGRATVRLVADRFIGAD